MRLLLLALSLAPAAAPQTMQRGETVFQRIFNGITAPEIGANVRNRGQSMHLVTVIFPTAAAAVTGIQLRIEASYDAANWFSIAPDITSAPRLGGVTYQIRVAYGPWTYVRLRYITASALPMTAWYSGQQPVTSYIQQEQDRFLL